MNVLLDKYKNYIRIGAIVIGAGVLLAVGVTGGNDPLQGAYKEYQDQSENEELQKLFEKYYAAYAKPDMDALEALATPISDKEKSYIKMLSKYIESYTIDEIYTKAGAEDGSFLVSISNKAKYKDLKKEAPGLDFFYVETKEDGTYYINNLYSLFNQQNSENPVDPTISALIATFEQQDDVKALQEKVQSEFNQLQIEDKDFKNYFNEKIPSAVTKWAENVVKEEQEAKEKAAKEAKEAKKKAEEEAKKEAKKKEKEEAKAKKAEEKAKKEEEAKKAEEEAKKAAEKEEAESAEKTGEKDQETETVYALEKVNVRKKPTTDSKSLGKVKAGKKLKRYSEKKGWSKIKYKGQTAYIRSDFLTTSKPEKSSSNSGLSVGDKVTLSQTVNIRERMSESADRVKVAYAGSRVKVLMIYSDGWSRVSCDGETGYMKTEFIK